MTEPDTPKVVPLRVDYRQQTAELKERLLHQLPAVLKHLLPHGVIRHGKFYIGDIQGSRGESMVLELNGDIVGTGAGAAALGHPVNAVVWLANTLGRLGIPLKAGEVILSGSLAALIPVKAGDSLRIAIGGLGGCSVRFV